MNFRTYLFLSIIFLTTLFDAQSRNILSGSVVDSSNGEPMPGVTVLIGVKGVVTNGNGIYSIPLPDKKSGKVSVSFHCIGYLRQSFEINLDSHRQKTLDVRLVPDAAQLSDAVIEGKRHNFGVKSPQMGAVALTGQQLKNIPVVFGEPDLLKAVQMMPGVQSGKDGNAGVMVRGGSYDQNLLTIDGASLFSSEHMRGFVTAFNPDMISSVAFLRGAFPANYGGRLSSVIDVAAKEGDFYTYHGAVSAGLMMGRLNASGPVVKGKTSFAFAARISYFDLIFLPEAQKHYDKIGVENPYSNLSFWDINLKLAHRFSADDKVSLFVMRDYDNQKTDPSKNSPSLSFKEIVDEKTGEKMLRNDITETDSKYRIRWANTLAAMNWFHRFGDDNRRLHTVASFSSYDYKRINSVNSSSKSVISFYEKPGKLDSVPVMYSEKTKLTFRSKISAFNLRSDFKFPLNPDNMVNIGAETRLTKFDPRQHIESERDNYNDWSIIKDGVIISDHRNEKIHTSIDSLVGKTSDIISGNLFVSDNFRKGNFEAIAGVRLVGYGVTGKTYLSVEPRLSAAWIFNGDMSVKASYSRMSQAERLLTSSSLVSPSDIWVPVTSSVKPMTSNVWAISFNRMLPWQIELSLETYYKTLSDIVDYKDGTDFSNPSGSWENQIAVGRGKSYGAEMFVRKEIGNTTGWISYTWSKALGKFDSFGSTINDGKEFYLPSDRRNNLAISLNHRIDFERFPGNHLDLSASFTYVTGRRYSVPNLQEFAGAIIFRQDIVDRIDASPTDPWIGTLPMLPYEGQMLPKDFFEVYMKTTVYDRRNNFKMPDMSSLDFNISLTTRHLVGESVWSIGVTNLLNHSNISDAFFGTDSHNDVVIKGICNFPIMPSISYTYSF